MCIIRSDKIILEIKLKKLFIILFACILISSRSFSQEENKVNVLLRFDDIGMCHSVNEALKEIIKTGLPISVSVMFACPWYQEAVDILKNNPQVSVGIHLTLNAEWKNYRWGPILGKSAVPSLVDSLGYFFPSRATFNNNHPSLAEIEKELRAQIERALNSGLKIVYLDHHMGTAVDKPEYRKILEKLAKEYHLGISQYFNENYTDNMYADKIENKADSLYKILNNLNSDRVNLVVSHIGIDNDELSGLIDLNSFGMKQMSKHRQAELNAWKSERIQNLLHSEKFSLITYKQLIDKFGLKNMKQPEVTN